MRTTIRTSHKSMPFDFVLEELCEASPYVKPMFGAYGVYIDDRILFILRDRIKSPEDNGIWLATTIQHHQSLQKVFPNMRSISLFGPGVTGWQNLPADSDDFEEAAIQACKLALDKDPRIGKVPKTKLKKKTVRKAKAKKKT